MTTVAWRNLLDPELVPALESVPVVDFDDWETFRGNSIRAATAAAASVDTDGLIVEDRSAGSSGVPVRIYRPDTSATRPGIVHMHGGGFVSGGADTGHGRLVELSRALDAVIVSVDYRLSPEHSYPAPLDDCFAALQWVFCTAAELGVDPDRIALHGVSAGGGLAAALAIRARDAGLPIRLQFLSIPILDDRMTTGSMRRFEDTPIWSRNVAEGSWRHYLGTLRAGSADVPADAAPGRRSAEELRGVAPAYLASAGLDPLVDESLEYAQVLTAAGVAVEAHMFPGAFHAWFAMVPTAEVSRRYLAEEITVLARALGLT